MPNQQQIKRYIKRSQLWFQERFQERLQDRFQKQLQRVWSHCLRIYKHFNQVRCFNLAAALAFTTLLSVVPLLVVMVSVLSALPVFDNVPQLTQDFIFRHFVPSAGEVVQHYLQQFAAHTEDLTTIGSGFLVVTAFLLMHSIHEIINEIWQVKESRPYYYSFILYALVLTVGPVLVAAGIAVSSYFVTLPFIAHSVRWGSGVQHLMPLFLSAVGFTVIYKFVPNARVSLKHALIGGIVAAVFFEIAKRFFTWYLTQFPTYEILYGALSVIPIFLLWVYISWSILLSGAVLVYCISEKPQQAPRSF